MLPDDIVEKVRKELDDCYNPLFFFHDDPDGTSAYVQLYRYKQEGKGNMVKQTPRITEKHLRWVEQFSADKVFVMDVALMDQEFIDGCPVPIVWLDHHEIQECEGVVYINAHKWEENTPPSVMAYQVCGKDLWLACVGAIADWYWCDLLYDCQKKYPKLLDIDLDSVKGFPEKLLWGTKLGELVDIISFNLKGSSKDALQSIKVLTRIENPFEILEQSSPQGKFLWKRYEKVKKCYEKEKESALKSYKEEDPLFVHTYTTKEFSVTKDLANELSYLHPEKVLVLARERTGRYVMSLRSGREGPDINLALQKILPRFSDSHGGGHPHACGASVLSEDFKDFLDALRAELGL